MTQTFVESCVDLGAHLFILMVWRLPYPEIPTLTGSLDKIHCGQPCSKAISCFAFLTICDLWVQRSSVKKAGDSWRQLETSSDLLLHAPAIYTHCNLHHQQFTPTDRRHEPAQYQKPLSAAIQVFKKKAKTLRRELLGVAANRYTTSASTEEQQLS